MNHYLHIRNRVGKAHVMEWWCSCGQAKGTGKTVEACQVSYDRHLIKAIMSAGKSRL